MSKRPISARTNSQFWMVCVPSFVAYGLEIELNSGLWGSLGQFFATDAIEGYNHSLTAAVLLLTSLSNDVKYET